MDIKKTISKISATRQWKSFLLFLPFLCASIVFWMVMTLNEDIQKDFSLPVEITNVPDSVTFISNIPKQVNITVKAKGSQLIKYSWKELPTIKVDFNACSQNNRLLLWSDKLTGLSREALGGDINIQSIRPDSLNLLYTKTKGIEMPIVVDAEISVAGGYVCYKPILCDYSSVMLYSVGNVSVSKLLTEPIILTNISETQSIKTKIITPANTRAIPDSVTVTIPIEPLIWKTADVKISVINVPDGYNLKVYPGTVNIKYLAPMSEYNNQSEISAIVDYVQLNNALSKLPISVVNIPEYIDREQMIVNVDSVECLLDLTSNP